MGCESIGGPACGFIARVPRYGDLGPQAPAGSRGSAPGQAFLLRNAELLNGRITDLRIRGGGIAQIGLLAPEGDEPVMDARGGLLLPGLHDHHTHIAALAASMASVRCGPPEVTSETELAAALGAPGAGWLRGIGYHESVTGGLIDRAWLDLAAPRRPVRVQHRGGRMWIFNSAGLAALCERADPPPGLDVQSGRLFDDDAWLRRALGSAPPGFAEVGAAYARLGVTGLTEMSPGNDDVMAAHFARERDSGALPQRVVLAGRLALTGAAGLTLGPVKLHLHEAALPGYDETAALIRAAHGRGRPVAVHCVTETELVFTLAALREAGPEVGDRIEHASVTSPALLREIADLSLAVAVQPHFAAERGDAYLADMPEQNRPDLYRLQSFARAGVVLAGGSDAPFGAPNPWAAMAAAVTRRTAAGRDFAPQEALTPEQALALFLADPQDLFRTRRIAAGEPADLVLLKKPWAAARGELSAGLVRAAFIGGRLVHDRIDEPPCEGAPRRDALA